VLATHRVAPDADGSIELPALSGVLLRICGV